MPTALPDLGGIATQDLVETIGSGSFRASYINWSRTMQLLRKHAPGWMVETVFSSEGTVIHAAPVGGVLLMRFRYIDGFTTPEVPQAIMDHKNNAIPFDRITARDVTDTHRRGACLVAAFQFGLAYELWAKMPLESAHAVTEENFQDIKKIAAKENTKNDALPLEASSDDEKTFMELAKSMGLCSKAISELSEKVKGNYANGCKTLESKDNQFVEEMNAKFQSEEY